MGEGEVIQATKLYQLATKSDLNACYLEIFTENLQHPRQH